MQDVVVSVVKHKGRFLFLQRNDGTWTFPSGKVEKGESLEEAVIRETKEETGQDCKISQCLGEREIGSNRLVYFLCDLIGDSDFQVEVDKFKAVTWMSPGGISAIAGDQIFSAIKDELSKTWKRKSQSRRELDTTLDVISMIEEGPWFEAQMAYLLRDKPTQEPMGMK